MPKLVLMFNHQSSKMAAPLLRFRRATSMNIQELILRAKQAGLGQSQRSIVCDTFRDAGEKAALELIEEYKQQEAKSLQAAKDAALSLCGVKF